MNNKKGFATIEVLVIGVILIVSVLIIGTFTSNTLSKTKKEAYKTEVLRAIQAGQTAYQLDLLNKKIEKNAKVCYSIDWLKNNNLFLKEGDEKDSYKGSVLVTGSDNEFKYTIWLENNEYIVLNGTLENLKLNGKENEDGAITPKKDNQASFNCQHSANQILRENA